MNLEEVRKQILKSDKRQNNLEIDLVMILLKSNNEHYKV